FFVERVNIRAEIWTKQTFSPVLNVVIFDKIEQDIGWNNAVPQRSFRKSLDLGYEGR
ncbi:hypothetical protein FRC11_013851, partial [Ceratobasidium sp. 423]